MMRGTFTLGDSFRTPSKPSESRGIRGTVVKTPKGGLKLQPAKRSTVCPSCAAAGKVRRRDCIECEGKGTVKAPAPMPPTYSKAQERAFIEEATRTFLACKGKITHC